MPRTKYFVLYTTSTPYEREAELLVNAFSSVGIKVNRVPYQGCGDWMKNCMMRSRELVSIASSHPDCNVCMFDADVRPLKKPILLEEFSADFGCEDHGPEHEAHGQHSAGVTIWGSTPAGRALLNRWAELCRQDPTPSAYLREQVYLHEAVTEALKDPAFRFVNIGNNYNRQDEYIKPGDDTVLAHYTASRRYLRKIGGRR